MVFKILDYTKTHVILSKTTWFEKLLHPIFGHPEVRRSLPTIRKTLKNPDYVYQSKRDPRSKLFFFKISQGEFAFYFLVVVVKYVSKGNKITGYVSTVMINKKLPKQNKPIWQKIAST